MSTFQGQSGGSIHSTASRIALPLSTIFPSRSTLVLACGNHLGVDGHVTVRDSNPIEAQLKISLAHEMAGVFRRVEMADEVTYKFRVKACNNSGVWNEDGASLDFVIPPTWYQTNWFYALCAATFLAMLWAAYQLRVRQLAAQFNMRLEERVSERTRIARDLHDTLLQSFQALLLRFQAVIRMLPDRPADARRTLEDAVDRASQAITEGRDAVQGLRLSTVEKNDLAVAIRTVGEELASAESNESSPELKVVVEGISRNLHPILRDEIYRLATEALRNAFRHAAAI